MSKRLAVECSLCIVTCACVILALGGIETMPRYMLDYISRANLVYQGF